MYNFLKPLNGLNLQVSSIQIHLYVNLCILHTNDKTFFQIYEKTVLIGCQQNILYKKELISNDF